MAEELITRKTITFKCPELEREFGRPSCYWGVTLIPGEHGPRPKSNGGCQKTLKFGEGCRISFAVPVEFEETIN